MENKIGYINRKKIEKEGIGYEVWALDDSDAVLARIVAHSVRSELTYKLQELEKELTGVGTRGIVKALEKLEFLEVVKRDLGRKAGRDEFCEEKINLSLNPSSRFWSLHPADVITWARPILLNGLQAEGGS